MRSSTATVSCSWVRGVPPVYTICVRITAYHKARSTVCVPRELPLHQSLESACKQENWSLLPCNLDGWQLVYIAAVSLLHLVFKFIMISTKTTTDVGMLNCVLQNHDCLQGILAEKLQEQGWLPLQATTLVTISAFTMLWIRFPPVFHVGIMVLWDTMHHSYICSCFCLQPLFLYLLWSASCTRTNAVFLVICEFTVCVCVPEPGFSAIAWRTQGHLPFYLPIIKC